MLLIMPPWEKREEGKFTFLYFSSFAEPAGLMRKVRESQVIAHRGRGGIRVIELDGRKLVVRAYRHGGLFRAFTGAFFLDQERVISEAEVMAYLRESGVPVAAPFAAVIERTFLLKRLYLLTIFEKDAVSLLEYLKNNRKRERRRAIRAFADLLWRLEQAGVYHRDLHLQNVLVDRRGRLMLLDFDRAVRKTLLRKDVESMVRRLCRFAEKMERRGRLDTDGIEKALFIRAYSRLSGYDIQGSISSSRVVRSWLHRLGWLFESFLFGDR